MNFERKVNIFFSLAIVLCIIQIWMPAYYLTGDGPCHVYNAKVLHDFWSSHNTPFYAPFYKVVWAPNPNWLSTIILALLMFVVNGIIAEKIFLTVYLAVYVSGFYLLLRHIGVRAKYLPLIIFVFVFPQVLSKGFYNFSFSIAFYFWVVWAWLRFLDKRNLTNALLFFVLTALIFFTHLLSFGIAAATCVALTLSFAISHAQNVDKMRFAGSFFRNLALLTLLLAPFILLMQWFTEKEGGLKMHIKPHLYRIIELVQFKYLVNVTHPEDIQAEVAGVVLLVLLLMSLSAFPKWRIHKFDGFLFTLVFVLFVYLCVPEEFLGRLILISMRVQIYVFIIMVCIVAYRFPVDAINKKAAIVISTVMLGFAFAYVYSLRPIAQQTSGIHVSTNTILIAGIIVPFAVLIAVWLGVRYKFQPIKMVNTGACVLFACFISLTIVRVDCQIAASTAAKDYLSAADHIPPNSVVLPLDFAPSGINAQGGPISDRNFLFYHAFQYAGLQKPLILLDNYEANMGYFPICWQKNVNPYMHLARGEGLEAQPPGAAIGEYKQNTGVSIDYIVMWGFDPSSGQNEEFHKLLAEINAGYDKVFLSGTGHTILYKRK